MRYLLVILMLFFSSSEDFYASRRIQAVKGWCISSCAGEYLMEARDGKTIVIFQSRSPTGATFQIPAGTKVVIWFVPGKQASYVGITHQISGIEWAEFELLGQEAAKGGIA